MEQDVKELLEKILTNQVVIFTMISRIENKKSPMAYPLKKGAKELNEEAKKVMRLEI